MRLGDLDALDRKIVEMTREPAYQHAEESWLNGLCMAMEAVNTAPTIDAVPVCRCKDCKFFATEAVDEDGWCENPFGLRNVVKLEDFCRYGVRRGLTVLELFAGTRSVGKEFEADGHKVVSIDWDKSFQNCIHVDVSTITLENVLDWCGRYPDVIWASFDCTTFSIAAISHHRKKNLETGELEPVSKYAKECDRIDRYVLDLIDLIQSERKKLNLHPAIVFIENPRGGLRKMSWMSKEATGLDRYTVTYCQYGDTRMKPTDIWTNHPAPKFKPMCKNGDPCHVRAPRGAKTGTQGLNGSKERSVIPAELCKHIVKICEEGAG